MCVRGGLSDGHAPIHPLDLQDIKELEVRERTRVGVNLVALLDGLRGVHICLEQHGRRVQMQTKSAAFVN